MGSVAVLCSLTARSGNKTLSFCGIVIFSDPLRLAVARCSTVLLEMRTFFAIIVAVALLERLADGKVGTGTAAGIAST
jgi:hypothetical protein